MSDGTHEQALTPTQTQVGYCGIEETRYHGFSVFEELASKESFLGMSALALLQRRITKEEADILDMLSAVLTAADPRIWPLKGTRLIAAYGSALSGMAAGHLSLVGSRIGPETVGTAALFLRSVAPTSDDVPSNEEDLVARVIAAVTKVKVVPGFGVPHRRIDERLVALEKYIAQIERDTLPYYRVMRAVVDVMKDHRPNAPPNISLGAAAVCLDIGFRPDDMAPLAIVLVFNTLLANAVESARQQSRLLMQLPKERVVYKGPKPRKSPRMVERMSKQEQAVAVVFKDE